MYVDKNALAKTTVTRYQQEAWEAIRPYEIHGG